jgi:molybdopterin/thiamine biosynthesis adenylyltransferase
MTVSSDDPLDRRVRKSAEEKSLPSGEPIRAIGHRQARKLAAASKTSLGRIYSRAAAAGVWPERFLRNANALSAQDQARLLNSRVAVVGLGGLGGTVVEILARIGIGAMTLIDGDRFEESNLNRQLTSTVEALGALKAEQAAGRVQSVNPAVEVTAHSAFFTRDAAERLLAGTDVVIDCLDSIPVRFELESAARAAGAPMISAAVGGATGHVTTMFPEDPGLVAIYGQADESPQKGSESELGCLPQAVFLLASLEASEAVKVLLDKRGLLRNRLLLVDLFENTFEIIQLS